MRIVVPPVLIGERILRVTAPVDSLFEVEEWTGEWWEPSLLTITVVSQAARAPEALLIARGVPIEDRTAGSELDQDLVQQRMHATESDATQDFRLDESATRRQGKRQRVFAGSARFRRGRHSSSEEQRDGAAGTDWPGPFRRASDREGPDKVRPRKE